GAARPEGPPPAAEDQFRADTVGRGCEEAAVAERMQRCELSEAPRACRLDRCAQPLDDRVGRRERDARGVVSASLLGHAASLRGSLDEELAEELRPPLRSAADEADECVAHLDVAAGALDIEDLRERLR